MMVRASDDIYRMADLKGKKIGLSRSHEHESRTTGGASRSTRASS